MKAWSWTYYTLDFKSPIQAPAPLMTRCACFGVQRALMRTETTPYYKLRSVWDASWFGVSAHCCSSALCIPRVVLLLAISPQTCDWRAHSCVHQQTIQFSYTIVHEIFTHILLIIFYISRRGYSVKSQIYWHGQSWASDYSLIKRTASQSITDYAT